MLSHQRLSTFPWVWSYLVAGTAIFGESKGITVAMERLRAAIAEA